LEEGYDTIRYAGKNLSGDHQKVIICLVLAHPLFSRHAAHPLVAHRVGKATTGYQQT
jgi:hypothetical protein